MHAAVRAVAARSAPENKQSELGHVYVLKFALGKVWVAGQGVELQVVDGLGAGQHETKPGDRLSKR